MEIEKELEDCGLEELYPQYGMLPQTEKGWLSPFVFRGLEFREHSGGIGMQVYNPNDKKWYDIEGLNWRASKDYYSHQYDIGLWKDRSYFGSLRFPQEPD